MPLHATADIEEGNLVVRPVGIARFLSLRSKIVTPVRAITSVTTEPDFKAVRGEVRGARWGGSSFPGLVHAGRFGWKKPSFLLVGRHRPLVAVRSPGAQFELQLFYAEDPHGVARKIERAITRT